MFKKLTVVLGVVSLFFVFTNVQADGLKSNWSLNVAGGGGIANSGGEIKDLFPSAFLFTVDAVYMMNDNFGIVPFSFNYGNLTLDKNKIVENMGFPEQYIDDLFMNTDWLAFTPGVYLSTSYRKRLRFFGQAGLGIYHLRTVGETIFTDGRSTTSEKEFGFITAAGFEYDLSSSAALVGSTRYQWINIGENDYGIVAFTGGIKFYL